MFSSSQQSGFISIFYSVGSNPLALWDKQVKNGHIRRVIDDEVKSLVLEVGGTNVATTYITCPIKPRASLGIRLPYLVMVIKNMKKYFSFEIQILDDKDMRRRFRVSNFQSTTKVRPFCTTMPIGLSSGWNQVQFNLADFTKRAYGSVYIEATRVQIHANVRIRRIYFTDQLHSDEELPNEFKLFAPGLREQRVRGREKKPSREAVDITQAEFTVPPIKMELKPDEEMPPPPSPAEESPVTHEEPMAAPTSTEIELAGQSDEAAFVEVDQVKPVEITETETSIAETETPLLPEEETKEEIKLEEITEATETDAPMTENEEVPIATTAEQGLETAVAAEEIQAAPVEGDQEFQATNIEAEGLAGDVPVLADGTELPAEEIAFIENIPDDTTVEPSETGFTEGLTDRTDDTDVSPSEPATTDEGDV